MLKSNSSEFRIQNNPENDYLDFCILLNLECIYKEHFKKIKIRLYIDDEPFREDLMLILITGTGEDFRYVESGASPHALTSVNLPGDQFRPPPDSTSYTCFNKIACITDTFEGNVPLKPEVIYGIDDQRSKSVLTEGSQTKRTRYY